MCCEEDGFHVHFPIGRYHVGTWPFGIGVPIGHSAAPASPSPTGRDVGGEGPHSRERGWLGPHIADRKDLMNTRESAVTLKAYRRGLGP